MQCPVGFVYIGVFFIYQGSVEYKRSKCAVQNASDLFTVVLGDVAGVVVVVLLPVLDEPVLLSGFSLQSPVYSPQKVQ